MRPPDLQHLWDLAPWRRAQRGMGMRSAGRAQLPSGKPHGTCAGFGSRADARGRLLFDNAMCVRFFATLECELIDRQSFPSQSAARMAVFDFIEGWYNPHRRHSGLDYLSPLDFERTHLYAQLAA